MTTNRCDGSMPGVEQRLALAEVGDVDAVAHEPLLVGVEAVERRGREVERVGHGGQ